VLSMWETVALWRHTGLLLALEGRNWDEEISCLCTMMTKAGSDCYEFSMTMKRGH